MPFKEAKQYKLNVMCRLILRDTLHVALWLLLLFPLKLHIFTFGGAVSPLAHRFTTRMRLQAASASPFGVECRNRRHRCHNDRALPDLLDDDDDDDDDDDAGFDLSLMLPSLHCAASSFIHCRYTHWHACIITTPARC